MNIDHMAEFAELARSLNFTATAKHLHMTQPALSNHIQILERECGVRLIERNGREKPRLTPAGQAFLDMCGEILGAYNRTMPHLAELARDIGGRVAIRTPRNEYSYPLVDYIFEFRRDHPNVDIAMLPWVNTDGVEDVLSGAVDCAYIGYGIDKQPHTYDQGTVAFVPYCSVQVFLWAENTHPLAAKPQLTGADIDGNTVLIPANEKRLSWVRCLEGVQERLGVRLDIEERYCDSLEDLIMTKARPSDLMLCDENTLKFAAFRLRSHHVALPFSPPLLMPVSLGYDANASNAALLSFVEFLAEKGGA